MHCGKPSIFSVMQQEAQVFLVTREGPYRQDGTHEIIVSKNIFTMLFFCASKHDKFAGSIDDKFYGNGKIRV